ncbi:hypothetical protein JYG23_03030 [Sedimentibacter sp. zth1]|uniref:hypothetical protein n=1 Tax=Sedimentibacter sp. zth1 TaxID=2816908 RepID=UPI001A929214|nr:hypothetical protein [Sedimentibacter sp. zth1]QSX06450.1 hypothetical protein JYG23_03030 [Sedimentibacter sp. zth1]
MRNVFFEDEEITENDLFFICYIIEKISRRLKQHNYYVVNTLGYNELSRKISVAQVLHCENPLQVVDDFIDEYTLQEGTFDITDVDRELVDNIPTELQMGKVYTRLILSTLEKGEDYVQGMIRVYNSKICEFLDDYNSSAYYEPSYVITQAYYRESFN